MQYNYNQKFSIKIIQVQVTVMQLQFQLQLQRKDSQKIATNSLTLEASNFAYIGTRAIARANEVGGH